MQNDPDQPAEPMGNRPDGLLVSQARHQAAIHGLEDASFGFDRGVGTLIENTPHVAVAFRGAVARGNLRTLFVSGACANHEERCFSEGNVAALAPTSARICCAESTPNPGTSASRCTASTCWLQQTRALVVYLADLLFEELQLLQRHLQQSTVDGIELCAGAQRVA